MASLNRIHRLVRLIEVQQSGRELNSPQLAENCGVSRRTIFRDLRTLQESGLAAQSDPHGGGYRFRSRVFVPPTDFTLDEALSLVLMCHELGDRKRGIPFQRPARSAGIKLLSALPGRLRETSRRCSDIRRRNSSGVTTAVSTSTPPWTG